MSLDEHDAPYYDPNEFDWLHHGLPISLPYDFVIQRDGTTLVGQHRTVQDYVEADIRATLATYEALSPKEDAVGVETKKERLLARREQIEQELLRLESLPTEPEGTGEHAVIFFSKQFHSGGVSYDYAAIKASNGLWYTTGPRAPKGYTWDQLVDFIGDAEIWVCTEWSAL